MRGCLALALLLGTPAVAQDALPSAVNIAAGEIVDSCQGSPIVFDPAYLTALPNAGWRVEMSGFSCDWQFGMNPWCGAKYCSAFDYMPDGAGSYVRTEETLVYRR